MRRSIKTNYIYNLAHQVISIILPLITTPYISRMLGSNGVGIYSYAMSITTYFILFGTLGISLYGQREIAYNQNSKSKRSKIFWELFVFRLITMVISMAIFFFMFAYKGEYHVYFRILLLEMLANIFDISWFYYGLEDFKKIAIRNILIEIVAALSLFVFVKDSSDTSIYVFIYSVRTLLIGILTWIGVHNLIELPKKLEVFRHFKKTIYLFIPQVAIQIYTVLDKTMIGAILNDMDEVGYYEQSQKIIKAMLVLVTGVTTVMMPRIASFYSENRKDKIIEYMNKTFKFVFMFTIPLMFGTIVVSDTFAPMFFGVGFEKVPTIMKILSAIIIFISISNITGNQYLLSVKREKEYTISVIVGAIVNVILNYILIRYYKSYGAAIATVIAELCVTVVQLYFVRKDFKLRDIFRGSIHYWIAGIIMFFVCLFLDAQLEHLMMSVIVETCFGIIVYFVLLLLFKDRFLMELSENVKKFILK